MLLDEWVGEHALVRMVDAWVLALAAVCAAFVRSARVQRLIAGTTAAIDGRKIRAGASRKAIAHQRELAALAQRNAQEIQRDLKRLDTHDGPDSGQAVRADNVRQALRPLKAPRRSCS